MPYPKRKNQNILQSLSEEITLYHESILEYQSWFKEVDRQLSPSEREYMQNIFNEYRKQKPIFQIMQKNIVANNAEEDAIEYPIYLQKISSRRKEQEEQIALMKKKLKEGGSPF